MRATRDEARVQEVARKSPHKVYSGVKSKVAGNMKSIRKTQTRTLTQSYTAEGTVEAPRRAKTYASPGKRTKKSTTTYHEKIISEIKNKYSKETINEMSQEQLASEILHMQTSGKRNGVT